MLAQAAGGLAECAALVAIGHQLRQAGLLRATDGQTALRLASYLTLPSLIVRTLCCSGPLAPEAWLGAGVALLVSATQAAATWLSCQARSKRESAVLLGCSVGNALPSVGLPVAEAVLGSYAALQPLALATLVNAVTVRGVSYLMFGSAGPAFPESFKHEDGGVYRGQWRGLRKEGLGVYTYPSGAKYEGEWRDNVKDGRGVYYYPKGGTYEGEWSAGVMSGVGVRTLASGEVRAGRWKNGQLDQPLEMWQCAYAAEGAGDAALAARKVQVGGGSFADACALLLQYAPLWAGAAALALVATAQPLPAAVDAVTAVLAPAHKPLALLALGATLELNRPEPNKVSDVSQILALRVLVPVALCASILVLVKPTDTQTVSCMGAVLLGLMAPMAAEVVQYARFFRLNDSLASAMVSTSALLSAPLLTACSVAVGLSAAMPALAAPVGDAAVTSVGVAPPPPPPGAAVVAQPLLIFCLIAAAAATIGRLRYGRRTQETAVDQRVLMVYAGPGAAAAAAARDGEDANPTSLSGAAVRGKLTPSKARTAQPKATDTRPQWLQGLVSFFSPSKTAPQPPQSPQQRLKGISLDDLGGGTSGPPPAQGPPDKPGRTKAVMSHGNNATQSVSGMQGACVHAGWARTHVCAWVVGRPVGWGSQVGHGMATRIQQRGQRVRTCALGACSDYEHPPQGEGIGMHGRPCGLVYGTGERRSGRGAPVSCHAVAGRHLHALAQHAQHARSQGLSSRHGLRTRASASQRATHPASVSVHTQGRVRAVCAVR